MTSQEGLYYEGRLAKLELSEAERPKIDPDFEEVTEGAEVERKENLKSKWAQLAAVVGAKHRLELVARDVVDHFEKRLEVVDGKAMVVCMSRRICVELHREIVALRLEWSGEGHHAGVMLRTADKWERIGQWQTPGVSDLAQQLVDSNPTRSRIVGMSTLKVSTTLDAASVAEAKALVGERGFSRFLNESLAMRLQRVRLERLLEEMGKEFGPIPDDARGWVEGQEWPR